MSITWHLSEQQHPLMLDSIPATTRTALKPPPPPERIRMTRLIRNNLWVSVRTRAESHPHDVAPSTAAVAGSTSTLLVLAVRAGAPLHTVQALVQANRDQLGVIHQYHGTVLHEAILHRSTPCVIRFLLHAMMTLYNHRPAPNGSIPNSILQQDDNLGRTALHLLVIHFTQRIRQDADLNNDETWDILECLIRAYPPALQHMDCDGNTPLLLALLVPCTTNSTSTTTTLRDSDEASLFRLIALMVSTDPSSARVAAVSSSVGQKLSHGASPNPLTYALLYGRSEATIQILLDAHQDHNQSRHHSTNNPCLTICSGHHEVPLHLAVSMRAECSMLSRLMRMDDDSYSAAAAAVGVGDVYQLTPLDWLWIRHVVDWCSDSTTAVTTAVSPSKRRYLSPNFLDWHRRVSREMSERMNHDEDKTVSAVVACRLRDSLWERASLLLPAAASAYDDDEEEDEQQQRGSSFSPWPPLHAACRVKTPLAMIQLALDKMSSSSSSFHAGQLPLHLACARRQYYYATVPVGASSRPRLLKETTSPISSLLISFPGAVRIRDLKHQQLPLHIAIERGACLEDMEVLFSYYPESLEQRDGKTKLYPFQQAAAVMKPQMDTIFTLLLKHPTLVASGVA